MAVECRERRISNCTVVPVESRFEQCIHTYYGVMPWTQSGDRLLYLGIDGKGTGHIVVQDLADGRELILADTARFSYHSGAGQKWIFSDSAVLFSTSDANGSPIPAVVYLDRPGEVQVLEKLSGRGVRSICGG